MTSTPKGHSAAEVDTAHVLVQARLERAPASLRAVGGVRILPGLSVSGMEPGRALHLSGARRRDHLLPVGTPVSLAFLLGEEVYSLTTTLLEPIVSAEGDTDFPPILRLAWPTDPIRRHRRAMVRLEAPDLPPLKARLAVQDRHLEATLLNLTESGMGLALAQSLDLPLPDEVDVDVDLPQGGSLRARGAVRHLARVDEDGYRTRMGLLLAVLSPEAQGVLQALLATRKG